MVSTAPSKHRWHHLVGVSLIVLTAPALVAGCGQTPVASTSHSVGAKTAVLGSSGIKMILSYQPSPPVSLKTFHTKVNLVASGGKPIANAHVTMHLKMLEMDMPIQNVRLKSDGRGQYSGHSIFFMAGPWQMTTDVTVNGKTMKESLTVHVGN